MGKQRRGDGDVERVWRERVSAWEASGLTARAFCLERGIGTASFYSWRRRLRSSDGAGARPMVAATTATFAPVTVVDSLPSRDDASIEITLPTGPTVRVIGTPPAESITTVLTALGFTPSTAAKATC